MARIDAQAIATERQWVTAADIIDAAVAYAGRSLDAHELAVDIESDRAVHVDPRLTSSALAHLLENAARYSPPRSRIEVRGYVARDEIRMSVSDAGPGLPPGEVDRLFEPFFRGAGPQVPPGSGMGLAIARGLLAAERGRIWAENREGGGARFWIAVPADSRPVVAASA
jgi:two-component system sensor histidine kinase KdpD